MTAWFAPPEYVILRKLEYYLEGSSEKHLNDIRAMLQQDELSALHSSEVIQRWAKIIGVSKIWTKLSKERQDS